jgi:HK97 family phage prohead protease
VTGVFYDLGNGVRERVQRGSFQKTLSERPDVQLLVAHAGMPLARSTVPAGQPGSLKLTEDDTGLRFEATADPEDTDAAAAHRKVTNGSMSEASFAFRVVRDQWSNDYSERTLQEVSLHRGDISICPLGASPTTSVSVRSLLAQRNEQGIDLATYRRRASLHHLRGK